MATKKLPPAKAIAEQLECIKGLRRQVRASERRARLLDLALADMRDRAINLNHKFLSAVGELREQYQGEPDALALELLAQHEERGADVAEAREFLEQQVPGGPGRAMEVMQAALRTELETLRAGRVHDQLDEVETARKHMGAALKLLLGAEPPESATADLMGPTLEDVCRGVVELFDKKDTEISRLNEVARSGRSEAETARRELASYLRRDMFGAWPEQQRDPLRLAKEVSL